MGDSVVDPLVYGEGVGASLITLAVFLVLVGVMVLGTAWLERREARQKEQKKRGSA